MQAVLCKQRSFKENKDFTAPWTLQTSPWGCSEHGGSSLCVSAPAICQQKEPLASAWALFEEWDSGAQQRHTEGPGICWWDDHAEGSLKLACCCISLECPWFYLLSAGWCLCFNVALMHLAVILSKYCRAGLLSEWRSEPKINHFCSEKNKTWECFPYSSSMSPAMEL